MKILIEADQSPSRDLTLETDDHHIPDVAVGVKVVVKVHHLATGKFQIIRDFEESKVLV